jgi:lipopolysaccharide transport system permease protein
MAGIVHADVQPTIIEPSRGWRALGLQEFWQYRELLLFFVWRDTKVRYTQTLIGVAWAVLQPLMAMIVFSVFFGRLAHMPSDGLPYPLFTYAALVPWTYFANALTQSSNSLVGSAHLISKVYFPRLVLPIAEAISALVDCGAALAVLFGLMFYFGVAPGPRLLMLPLLMALAVVTATGVGLWLAALNVEYRDVRFVLPFFVQIWLFATPVVYPASILHEPWRTLYGLNPMSGVVEGFRWALLGARSAPGPLIFVSAAVAIVVLVTGAFYFRRMERTFADVV